MVAEALPGSPELKIISNTPDVPDWQKLQPASTADVVAWGQGPVELDLGNPLSVLPERVQEQLRAGLQVDAKDIVRVPER